MSQNQGAGEWFGGCGLFMRQRNPRKVGAYSRRDELILEPLPRHGWFAQTPPRPQHGWLPAPPFLDGTVPESLLRPGLATFLQLEQAKNLLGQLMLRLLLGSPRILFALSSQ